MKTKLTAVITSIILAGTALFAQNGTMTPYSQFGYGMLRDGATSTQRSMGGIGVAMNNGRQINTMNPASYAATDSLTFLFDMGIDFTTMWQRENTSDGHLSDKRYGGGLDYATMQFPLGKYMGMSIGVLPYSAIGYAFGSKIDNGIDSRQGSGTLSQLYAGIAGRPFKGFSVGANISYLFGTLLNETYSLSPTGSSSYAVYQNQLEVRDYHLEFGIQYALDLRRKADRLVLGLTYSPAKDLLGNARKVAYSPTEGEPTFEDQVKLRHNYSIAASWGAGINYTWNNKLMVEADYHFSPWSKAKYRGFDDSTDFSFADRTKYNAGVQFRPAQRGNYFSLISYRLGGYFCDDYLKVGGNQLREYSLSCGFGFPVPSFKTTINLGFEWVKRQAHPSALVKENYFNLTLGVNFNEMWFFQNKLY